MTPVNSTLESLRQGTPVLGAWALSMSPRVAEVLSASSLDWVGIDMEHTPITLAEVEELVRAIERGGATPIVRLSSPDAVKQSARVLDTGAQGLIVPRVETPTDVERILDASRFPPEGTRGAAGTTRANRYGSSFEEYATGWNDELLTVAQIESKTAVDSVEAILDVDGLDVAFIGENDLSTSYGCPGRKDDTRVRSAVETVLTATTETDVLPGIAGRTAVRLSERLDRGFRFFLLGSDLRLIQNGVQEVLQGNDTLGRGPVD